MMKFLASTIKYPVKAQEEGAQGRVILRFIVEKDGSTSNVEVVKSAHELLDKEAARVVNLFPTWTPGKVKDEPVRVSFVVPVQFRLQ